MNHLLEILAWGVHVQFNGSKSGSYWELYRTLSGKLVNTLHEPSVLLRTSYEFTEEGLASALDEICNATTSPLSATGLIS